MDAAFRWSAPVRIPLSSPAVDEFSLTGDESHAILAFKNDQGNVFMKVRDATPNSWSGDEIARDPAGNDIKTPGFLSCPAVLEVTESSGRRVLLGLFPEGDQGLLRLYSQDPSNGRWVKSPWQLSDESTIGRPTMTWEPVGAGSPMPGRLRIFYLRRPTVGGDRIVRQRTLQAIGLGAQSVLRLVDEDHDNGLVLRQRGRRSVRTGSRFQRPARGGHCSAEGGPLTATLPRPAPEGRRHRRFRAEELERLGGPWRGHVPDAALRGRASQLQALAVLTCERSAEGFPGASEQQVFQ
jgi:hypothetical protein